MCFMNAGIEHPKSWIGFPLIWMRTTGEVYRPYNLRLRRLTICSVVRLVASIEQLDMASLLQRLGHGRVAGVNQSPRPRHFMRIRAKRPVMAVLDRARALVKERDSISTPLPLG